MRGALAKKVRELKAADKIDGMRIGHIAEINPGGMVTVDYPGNIHGPLQAKVAGSIKARMEAEGLATEMKALLLFEEGDPKSPVIIDTLHEMIEKSASSAPIELKVAEAPKDVIVDGERVTFDAKESIVLRCGKSSITLTRAGKIIIKGAYLLNRSSGVNRIKGASVQIN